MFLVNKEEIERTFGDKLLWECLDDKKYVESIV